MRGSAELETERAPSSCKRPDLARLASLSQAEGCLEPGAFSAEADGWSRCTQALLNDGRLLSGGDLVVSGRRYPDATLGCGPVPEDEGRAFVARYAADGTCLFRASLSRALGLNPDNADVLQVVPMPQGHLLAVGRIPEATLEGLVERRAVEDEQGFVVKLDGVTGAPVWSRLLLDIGRRRTSESQARAAVAEDGSVYLVGEVRGRIDFGPRSVGRRQPQDLDEQPRLYIAKFGAGGEYLWHRAFGGSVLEHGFAIATRGDLVVASARTHEALEGPCLPPHEGPAFVLLGLDPQGETRFAHVYQSPSSGVLDIGIRADGGIGLAGFAWSDVDLGGGTLALPAGVDVQAWVAMFDAQGEHLESRAFPPAVDVELRQGQRRQSFAQRVRWTGGDRMLVDFSSSTPIEFGHDVLDGYRHLVELDDRLQPTAAGSFGHGEILDVGCDGEVAGSFRDVLLRTTADAR